MQCHLKRVAHAECIRALRIKRALLGGDVEVLPQCDLRVHVSESAGKSAGAVLGQRQGLLVCGSRCRRKEEVADQDSAVPTEIR